MKRLTLVNVRSTLQGAAVSLAVIVVADLVGWMHSGGVGYLVTAAVVGVVCVQFVRMSMALTKLLDAIRDLQRQGYLPAGIDGVDA